MFRYNAGYDLVASIIVGIVIGRLLDLYIIGHPYGTIVGVVFGFISGIWQIYKTYKKNL